MDVAVTGSTGLIGTALVDRLRRDGHRVVRVVRGEPRPGEDAVRWDPARDEIDAEGLKGVDAVVHLAGEPIGAGRWTAARKRRIRESRARGTALIARTVADLDPRPSVLLSASGINYYGDRGDEVLTEASGRGGPGFLTDVVADAWEAPVEPAAAAGVRTVLLRSAVVLSPEGGALGRVLPLFRLGLGGRLGSGRQWFSWISRTDEVGAIAHLLTSELSGPVNLTAPEPVTNAEYTRVLGRVLGRPAVLPIPALGPKVVVGRELAEELVLASMRVLPERLLADGYAFAHPTVEAALRAELGRPAPG